MDVLWTLATELSTTVELNVPLATKGDNAICGQCEPNMPVARRAKHKANSLMAPTTASAARTSRIKRAVPPVEGVANEVVKRTAENNTMEVGSKSTIDANPSSSERSVGGIVGNTPCGNELTDAELTAVDNAKALVNTTIAPSLTSDRISHRKAPNRIIPSLKVVLFTPQQLALVWRLHLYSRNPILQQEPRPWQKESKLLHVLVLPSVKVE